MVQGPGRIERINRILHSNLSKEEEIKKNNVCTYWQVLNLSLRIKRPFGREAILSNSSHESCIVL
jgi:hypothetical protein